MEVENLCPVCAQTRLKNGIEYFVNWWVVDFMNISQML